MNFIADHPFKKHLKVLAAGALFAAALGGALNAVRRQPLPWRYADKAARLQAATAALPGHPTAPAEVGYLTAAEVATPPAGTMYVVLDARPTPFYRQGHVPGALSLPRENFGLGYPQVQAQLGPPATQALVVYCQGGECVDSEMVAHALTEVGHRRVYIMLGGWNEWQTLTQP